MARTVGVEYLDGSISIRDLQPPMFAFGSLWVSGGRLKKNIRLIHGVSQVHGVSFKKRAPRAIKEIKGFAEKAMVRGVFPLLIAWHLATGLTMLRTVC
jgi:hypothetical protein